MKDELFAIRASPSLGDFNVAPEDRDVHNPKRWEGGSTSRRRSARRSRELLELGFTDAFRLFEQPEKEFSWWDYRLNAFQRGWGLRIDHILLSAELASAAGHPVSTRRRASSSGPPTTPRWSPSWPSRSGS